MKTKKDILQINFRNRIITAVALNIIVVIVLVYFIIYPAIISLQEIKNAVNDKKIELEAKSFQVEDIKKYFEEKKNIEPQVSSLDLMLLNQDKSLKFINDLEQIGIKNNVDAKINLLQSKSEEIGLYNRIPISFSVVGEMPNLMNYIVDIETLNYYININSLELSKKSFLEENENKINMSISASTYWEK